jgi:hypothetical protein
LTIPDPIKILQTNQINLASFLAFGSWKTGG